MADLHASFLALQEAFINSRSVVLAAAGQQASETKHDNTPVTETDRAVELYIMNFMKDAFPDLVVLGEEGGYDPESLPETCWLIDPIDGTKSFIHNIPAFTGMAVLIENGVATMSIIYDYSTGDIYTAVMDKGAHKNGQQIQLRDIGMSHKIYSKGLLSDKLAVIFEPVGFEIETSPSGAGFGFAQVVDGVSAGRFHLHSGMHIHDHAPGALLVREAGGAIIPVLDASYTFKTRSFVACHPDLEPTVREHLAAVQDIEDPNQALA